MSLLISDIEISLESLLNELGSKRVFTPLKKKSNKYYLLMENNFFLNFVLLPELKVQFSDSSNVWVIPSNKFLCWSYQLYSVYYKCTESQIRPLENTTLMVRIPRSLLDSIRKHSLLFEVYRVPSTPLNIALYTQITRISRGNKLLAKYYSQTIR